MRVFFYNPRPRFRLAAHLRDTRETESAIADSQEGLKKATDNVDALDRWPG